MLDLTLELAMRNEAPLTDDAALIRQMQSGDSRGLQNLYQRYGKRMYAYALRLVSDPHVAEDVIQESLVSAWQGAAKYRGKGRLIAWLLGIVHHKAMRTFRQKPTLELDEITHQPGDPDHSPAEYSALNEQRQTLQDALAELSLEHRTVLELVFYQELSLEETARVIGRPVGTVKSRLSYAKDALRGTLQREGITAEDIR